ncbi:ComF family protein [Hydrogenophaga sp.]|uniref:ComF family protein n=1 Tax=Hydrogenophaga sp. TaxID=1904254 RepID=UPI0025B9B022|nr:phosphoribosyltransferase family protein [Hydrogenophaga sp.]
MDYAFPWSGLIGRFKFGGEPGWALPFADLMLQRPEARTLLASCDALVPIALTPQRVAERGHHAPWELARALGRRAGLACRPDWLQRVKEGPAQRELSRDQRLRNLGDAFAVPRHAFNALRGARLALVDDVTTTGATLQAAANALRQAGAREVSALVFARTPAPHETPG